jgi:glucosamine-6-phosphate deaminase
MRIEIAESASDLARRAADVVCEVVEERRDATMALPSGSTPLEMYDELARRASAGVADLSGATVFAVDELYAIDPSHPATNASYFRRHVSGRITLRKLHVMRSDAAEPSNECARFVSLIELAGGLDLAVLGIGVNGHVAFNEPGSPFDSRARLVDLARSSREAYMEAFGSFGATPERGLTLGIADLMAARRVLLIADGEAKAAAVATALDGPVTESVPASALQQHRDALAVLDRMAASRLRRYAS